MAVIVIIFSAAISFVP